MSDPTMAPLQVRILDTNGNGRADEIQLTVGPSNNRITVEVDGFGDTVPMTDAQRLQRNWEASAGEARTAEERNIANGSQIYGAANDWFGISRVEAMRMAREFREMGNEGLAEIGSNARIGPINPRNINVIP